MISPNADAALRMRLATVAAPDYYLEILGTAFDDAESTEEAIAIADRIYEQYPYGVPSEADDLMRAINDAGNEQDNREAYVRTELPKALTAVTGKMTTPDTIQKILDHKE